MPVIAQAKCDQGSCSGELPEIAVMTAYLRQHLGVKVTAYLSGAEETRDVNRWVSGEIAPEPVTADRVRHGYEAVRLLVSAYGSNTAQAWFFGKNTQLDGHAPASALREGTDTEDWSFVVTAAKTFVEMVP